MGRAPSTRAIGNLPEPITSFVGRRMDVQRTKQRMADSRMVTLVGPGGVGKTRMATEVAAASRKAFPDGTWLIDLASLTDGDRVAHTILSALDVRDQSTRPAEGQLVDHLADRHLLLVVDNCEHLLEPCARILAAVLRSAPNVRVLATSREALGIAGEHLLEIPSLSTPDAEHPPPLTAFSQFEAVALLLDRARSVRPDFAVTEENRVWIARLCTALDGLPLAIELAATRLRSLSVEELTTRLDDRFRLLTGGNREALPRQQTLRALIDWSYELCSPQEQRLWRRLSVFAGDFDLAAAEGVCADDDLHERGILDLLDQLVGKSIVLTQRSSDRVRYRMLVTVRHYGAELLRDEGRADVLARRHRDHYHQRALRTAERWLGPGQVDDLRCSRADHHNIRAALQQSCADDADPESLLSFVAALRYHWVVGGFLQEGRIWLDRALAASDAPTATRGRVTWAAAWVSLLQGDAATALDRIAACRDVARHTDDAGLAAYADGWEGLAALFSGEVHAAVPLFERALAGHRRAQDTGGVLMTMFQLAPAQAYAQDPDAAGATCAEALALADEHGERWARAYASWASGIVAWHRGDLDAVERHAQDALATDRRFKDGVGAALSIELLCWAAAAAGRHDDAARLAGAATGVWSEIGTTMHAFGPHMDADSQAARRRASGAIGEQGFAALAAETSSLGVDAAIAFAVSGELACRSRPNIESPLTAREAGVAALVAEGRTNREIAATLVLSTRTIDGHLERILAKLGFASRAQVAAWVSETSVLDGP